MKIVSLVKSYPKSKFIAHPESKSPILEIANYVGSTSGLLSFVQNDDAQEYIIATEAGILHEWNRDIYFILGDQTNGKWQVKVYLNPFVRFIWLGVIIMLYSGLIGVIRK